MSICTHNVAFTGTIRGINGARGCRNQAVEGLDVCSKHTPEALEESKRLALARSDKAWEKRKKWKKQARK